MFECCPRAGGCVRVAGLSAVIVHTTPLTPTRRGEGALVVVGSEFRRVSLEHRDGGTLVVFERAAFGVEIAECTLQPARQPPADSPRSSKAAGINTERAINASADTPTVIAFALLKPSTRSSLLTKGTV
jgi:hypothetical protein